MLRRYFLALVCLASGGFSACMPNPLVPSLSVATPERDSRHLSDFERGIESRPYKMIIPEDARTRVGMFTTHQVNDRLYFEIPPAQLNVDMLLVGRYARASADAKWMSGGDEFAERTVRWERVGNRIFLRTSSFAVMADTTLPVYRAIQAGNYAPIIATFDITTFSPDSNIVIDVTRLFTTGVPELSALHGPVDPNRSYIENVVAFPTNVEIEATQTGTLQGGMPLGNAPAIQQGSVRSVVAHWSMVRLPDVPMRARQADSRVGYFDVTRTDFGTPEAHSVEQHYITRWRLEKRDTTSAVSEPVTPIVYYIDPATPEQWRPWIRKAVLDWQPAFEAAGFKNAIIAEDAPTDDPDWSPEDVRHTMVRWIPSTLGNAQGPHVADPRTGEILNGSIRIFHDILSLQRDWYFTQVGALDARAQQWPMPDSLLGRLLEYTVAHEIGHTLGLRHNQLASSLYPADSLRSPTWTHTMGSTPSIMDYARYNYVAQPEDHLALEDLVPRIGPYDVFAIRWGYAPVESAMTMQSEQDTLDQWAMVQDTIPWLRFAEWNPAGDYGTALEALGDADPVWSAEWGLKNLQRVVQLIPKVAIKPGRTTDDLERLYTQATTQWRMEMEHVITIVGGATVQFKSGSQPGPVFTPLPRERQQAAVQFLNAHAFTTPAFLIDVPLTRRIEPTGTLARITALQVSLLSSLLSKTRMQRMIEYSALHAQDEAVYSLTDMVRDLQDGIWSELFIPQVSIDAFRQALQSAYLDACNEKLNGPSPNPFLVRGTQATADDGAVMRGALMTLQKQVTEAVSRSANQETYTYLDAVREEIARILEPNK